MLEKNVTDRLKVLAQEIKEIVPNLNGQVIFNCAQHLATPKVDVMGKNVTEVKK